MKTEKKKEYALNVEKKKHCQAELCVLYVQKNQGNTGKRTGNFSKVWGYAQGAVKINCSEMKRNVRNAMLKCMKSTREADRREILTERRITKKTYRC